VKSYCNFLVFVVVCLRSTSGQFKYKLPQICWAELEDLKNCISKAKTDFKMDILHKVLLKLFCRRDVDVAEHEDHSEEQMTEGWRC
jgi:hypothetical protein